jgi:hypothetical protein
MEVTTMAKMMKAAVVRTFGTPELQLGRHTLTAFHDITRGNGGYHLHTGALKRLGDSATPGTA